MHVLKLSLLALALSLVQNSAATQLGASKGTAVFGRPLDLSIPIRLDAPATDLSNCFSADIFQADTKFDAGRVRIDVTPAANGLDAVVRVRSVTTIIEPWAKVILRSNCGIKVTRQYDFLTDFSTELPALPQLPQFAEAAPIRAPTLATTASIAASSTLVASNMAPVMNPIAQIDGKATEQRTAATKVKKPKATKQLEKPQSTNVAKLNPLNTLGKQSTSLVTNDGVALASTSRLKMETFELADERQVMLKLSSAMLAPTGMRSPQEIQALAQATAVWRVMNGLPALENSTANTTVLSNSAQVADAGPSNTLKPPTPITAKAIAKSTTDDVTDVLTNPLVLGLIALLALALGCIAWLWLRMRKAAMLNYAWLAESADFEQQQTDGVANAASRAHLEAAQSFPSHQTATHNEHADVGVDYRLKPIEQLSSDAALSSNNAAEQELMQSLKQKDSAPLETLQSTVEKISNLNNQILATETVANKPLVINPIHLDDFRFDQLLLADEQKTFNETAKVESLTKLHAVPKHGLDTDPFALYDTTLLRDQTTGVETETKSEMKSESKSETKAETKAKIKTDKKAYDNLNLAPYKPTIKSESKGNLIDFDSFSEPMPPARTTKFAR